MSYAAFKVIHGPTGVEHCAAAFVTHCPGDCEVFDNDSASAHSATTRWRRNSSSLNQNPPGSEHENRSKKLPNLVVCKANVLEIYNVLVKCELPNASALASMDDANGFPDEAGISSGQLELVCSYRLHGNVESLAILTNRRDDGRRQRDALLLTFREAKISVLEFEPATFSLKTSSMHYFEGPDWLHLKRGREKFPRGPAARGDPLGRCIGVLLYDCQLALLKAAQRGFVLAEEDKGLGLRGTAPAARVKGSYTIDLRAMGHPRTLDFGFLHGYNEPVVALLTEQEATWPGGTNPPKFSCSVVALTLNMNLKQHPVLWSSQSLPQDVHSLVPVGSPIGGVLIIGTNTLHYCSQASSCHLALNEFAAQPEGGNPYPRSATNVELDAAHATWLSADVALLSAKTGQLLLLSLTFDGRSVQKLELTHARSSALASSLCTLGNSFFFLGSRLGDSLLVQFWEGKGRGEIDSQGPAKRLKPSELDTLNERPTPEELSLYSNSVAFPHETNFKARSWAFSVRDALAGIGPLRDVAYGLRSGHDPDAQGLPRNSNYELIGCSGHAKNGALTVLHRSIRPDLVTEVDLPGCEAIWTVYHKSEQAEVPQPPAPAQAAQEDYHAFLILSLAERTMVLETGETLGEVTDAVEYFTDGPTLAAANLFSRLRVVQVYPGGVRLLDGAAMCQELLTADFPGVQQGRQITAAAIADPYIAITMTDGNSVLISGDEISLSLSLQPMDFSGQSENPVTALSLYRDSGGWLLSRCPAPSPDSTPAVAGSTQLEELILGNTSGFETSPAPPCYALVGRRGGELEIYHLPDLRCVFRGGNFWEGPQLVCSSRAAAADGHVAGPTASAAAGVSKREGGEDVTEFVVEISMQAWGASGSHGPDLDEPFLTALMSDGRLMCYRAFSFHNPERDRARAAEASLRFKRLDVEWVNMEGSQVAPLPTENGPAAAPPGRGRLVPFSNVGGGLRGLFVAGPRPGWLLAFRGRLRLHPQLCDGEIVAFTPLHNVNCLHGFIYATAKGQMKISQLPPQLSYDNDWPHQKVPLDATPHCITYSVDAKMYFVITSSTVMQSSQYVLALCDTEGGEGLQAPPEDSPPGPPIGVEEFELRVIQPPSGEVPAGTWETRQKIPLNPLENGLEMKMVTLKNTSTNEMESLLALGTAYVQGEDIACRGRIVLFRLSIASSEAAHPLAEASEPALQLEEAFCKEQKGAISAMAALQGFLLVAIGNKLILHTWNGQQLSPNAFFDAALHVVSLNTVKNYVLVGDVHQSVAFLQWKAEGAQLTQLAKDFEDLHVTASEFVVDGGTLTLLAADGNKNIQIFAYAPKSAESWKGQKLLARAEFHVGAHVSKFLRLQMLPPPALASAGPPPRGNRFAVLSATLDGALHLLAPLDELTFRRLQALQRRLVDAIPHVAGLNPKAFRQFRSGGCAHRSGPDNIVDCELLHHYSLLEVAVQCQLASQIGTSRMQVLANLRDLAYSTSFL